MYQNRFKPRRFGGYQKGAGNPGYFRKRPVRSFRDLEVYQKCAQMGVEILQKVIPALGEGPSPFREPLMTLAIRIPRLLADAHSKRFDATGGLTILDEAMAECNNLVVHLDQAGQFYSRA